MQCSDNETDKFVNYRSNRQDTRFGLKKVLLLLLHSILRRKEAFVGHFGQLRWDVLSIDLYLIPKRH